jgi:hypothetical protein
VGAAIGSLSQVTRRDRIDHDGHVRVPRIVDVRIVDVRIVDVRIVDVRIVSTDRDVAEPPPPKGV